MKRPLDAIEVHVIHEPLDSFAILALLHLEAPER
jgi:hypothetical protein